MKTVRQVYFSFIWAVALASVCFQSNWLEMRVNIGLLLFIFAGIIYVAQAAKNFAPSLSVTAASLAFTASGGALLLGGERFIARPALMIREGLSFGSMPLSSINTALMIFLASGAILIIFDEMKNKKLCK